MAFCINIAVYNAINAIENDVKNEKDFVNLENYIKVDGDSQLVMHF